jgi:RNA-directed DNA polymerase
VTDASQPSQPTTVPDEATRVGAVRARWVWTAPEVWTERMLTALEQGVRGGRWYTLMDKVCPLPTLRAAFARVKANRGAAGVDHVTVAMYEARLDANLAALSASLRDDTYRPHAIRRHWIPKGPRERRPLGIPTVRDRVVQTALRLVLEPIFDGTFAPHSYGFRPGRGAKDALRQVDRLLRAGYRHVVDADLRSYFDTIPHARLRARVASKVSDRRVLALLDAFLQQPIFEGLAQWTVEQGTPQGAVVSPLLANLYLDPLDHMMAEAGFQMGDTRMISSSCVAPQTTRHAHWPWCSAGRTRPGYNCIQRKPISWICRTLAALTSSATISCSALGCLARRAWRNS